MKKLLIAAGVALIAVSATFGYNAVAGDSYAKAAKAEKPTMSIYETAKKGGFTTLIAAVSIPSQV